MKLGFVNSRHLMSDTNDSRVPLIDDVRNNKVLCAGISYGRWLVFRERVAQRHQVDRKNRARSRFKPCAQLLRDIAQPPGPLALLYMHKRFTLRGMQILFAPSARQTLPRDVKQLDWQSNCFSKTSIMTSAERALFELSLVLSSVNYGFSKKKKMLVFPPKSFWQWDVSRECEESDLKNKTQLKR